MSGQQVETSDERVARLLDGFVTDLEKDSRSAALEPYLKCCQSSEEQEDLLVAALEATKLVAHAKAMQKCQLVAAVTLSIDEIFLGAFASPSPMSAA